ncbi:Dihydrolipoamide succinyltransferase component (E2) of 2-oxoglutarate dehydrogenase complex [hydrothermal vent metagenome]|uniref:dihydrolipoyllysine-residue succinyltransferase n=1 Tax=hydrothermal vent metagenome TaxID=652676 RepID=A0A3B0TU06_9ZZZZ
MSIDIKVPELGESVTEATIGQWLKKVGDAVAVDEPLVELETDKVALEVPSPVAGVLESIVANTDDNVEVGSLIATIAEGAVAAEPAAQETPAEKSPASEVKPVPVAPVAPVAPLAPASAMEPSPSAQKMINEKNIPASDISGSGKRGQVLKEDVMAALDKISAPGTAPAPAAAPRAPSQVDDLVREERVKITRLRQTIARRLKDAQNTAAMLTTFNEVDMGPIMELRKQYKELFEKKHGVKLGFMGFFCKAVTHALKEVPNVNAEIDGNEIIYKNYAHIGVAVGTDRGLVVPVVRDADQMSIAQIEQEIGRLGRAARDGKLSMADMQGGTFTISNGGVYGSLMSTPILNAPQSGILGMHKIQQRPMAVDGQVVIRPMMYLALSYDHRIVDGKEAVTFLVRVKESLEDPQRLVLDL